MNATPWEITQMSNATLVNRGDELIAIVDKPRMAAQIAQSPAMLALLKEAVAQAEYDVDAFAFCATGSAWLERAAATIAAAEGRA